MKWKTLISIHNWNIEFLWWNQNIDWSCLTIMDRCANVTSHFKRNVTIRLKSRVQNYFDYVIFKCLSPGCFSKHEASHGINYVRISMDFKGHRKCRYAKKNTWHEHFPRWIKWASVSKIAERPDFVVIDLFKRVQKLLYILCFFNTKMAHRWNRSSWKTGTLFSHCQYKGCRWPGDARFQRINNHGTDLLPEYSRHGSTSLDL